MESRRQDFEAYVLKCGYSYGDLLRAGNGYWGAGIQEKWEVWNAALDSLAVQS